MCRENSFPHARRAPPAVFGCEEHESLRDYFLLLTAYRHGLRATEIGLLQIADVDFKRMQKRARAADDAR